jgi:hypothetical protein
MMSPNGTDIDTDIGEFEFIPRCAEDACPANRDESDMLARELGSCWHRRLASADGS